MCNLYFIIFVYRSENVMNDKLLKEKEQVIAELLEEGNKVENLTMHY